jgi:DNA-binding response OmpR family regulator
VWRRKSRIFKEVAVALILIADDDEIVVCLVRDALGARGHVVGALDDGLPVLGVVEFKLPELVILDCSMPELSGIEALRQIRTSRTCFATPVLMLTGRRSAADEEIAMRSGANDYLRKPFDPDQLVSRVEILVAKRRARQLADTMPVPVRTTPPAERRWGQR